MSELSGKHIARGVTYNLIGSILPLIVAVYAIPELIKGLGVDRFGILTLAWMVVGYFSFFDMGLGRALTKLVAERLGTGEESDIPKLVWTAMSLIVGLGVIGGGVLGLLADKLVVDILTVPEELCDETIMAFYLLSIAIPVVVVTAGLRGILEAYQRFDFVNLVSLPLGVMNFLGPLLALHVSNSLFFLVAVLVTLRFLASLAYALLCFRVSPGLSESLFFEKKVVRSLLSFGGWMTVSNIIGPLMVYFDRFFIGSIIGMAAVTYYVTPYEVITKLWTLPMALLSVLFPAFSSLVATDRKRTYELYQRSINVVGSLMLPITIIVIIFSETLLTLWVGEEIAQQSYEVMQWLAIGVLLNCLGRIPFVLLQSIGRPDLSAKILLIELPFYMPLLWYYCDKLGIKGAAMVWSARVLIDTIIFFGVAAKLYSDLRRGILMEGVWIFSAVVLALMSVYSSSIVNNYLLLLIAFGFIVKSSRMLWLMLRSTAE